MASALRSNGQVTEVKPGMFVIDPSKPAIGPDPRIPQIRIRHESDSTHLRVALERYTHTVPLRDPSPIPPLSPETESKFLKMIKSNLPGDSTPEPSRLSNFSLCVPDKDGVSVLDVIKDCAQKCGITYCIEHGLTDKKSSHDWGWA